MKIKTKLKACFVCILSVATGTQAAITAKAEVSAANPQTITFSASVVESLSVTINQTNIASGSGSVNSFLRSSFDLSVSTNNSAGYVASMYSTSSTALSNGTSTIQTLSAAAAKSTFASTNLNRWGYSIKGEANGDTDAGITTAVYNPMSTSPITIASSTGAVSGSTKTVFFGTQVDTSVSAGSYTNNVTVNVVSPYSASPSKPAASVVNTTSQDATPSDNYATYVSSGNGSGNSVYANPSNTSSVNNTQIISGNYTGEVSPLGVTESTYYTTSETTGGSSMMTGLLVASATAAVSGGLFFLLSRSRDDDEEENY